MGLSPIIPDLWFHISKIMEICKEAPSLVEPGKRLRETFHKHNYAEMATVIKNRGGVRYYVPSAALTEERKAEISKHIDTALSMLHEHGFFGAI